MTTTPREGQACIQIVGLGAHKLLVASQHSQLQLAVASNSLNLALIAVLPKSKLVVSLSVLRFRQQPASKAGAKDPELGRGCQVV